MNGDLPHQPDPPSQSGPLEFTPEERAEFEAWERLSDEAWAMIDRWEAEEAARDKATQPPESND